MRRLRDVGVKWRQRTEGNGVVHGREVVFTWMDEGKWADWMKSMYGLAKRPEGKAEEEGLDGVRVVIADHSVCVFFLSIFFEVGIKTDVYFRQKLIYYDTDRAGNAVRFTSSASMFAAVDDAASGKSTFKNSEGTVERMARVCQLVSFFNPFLLPPLVPSFSSYSFPSLSRPSLPLFLP